MRRTIAILAVLPLLSCRPAGAQSLSQRVLSAPDGVVRLSFPARPGVCGHEDGILVRDSTGRNSRVTVLRGRWNGDDELRDRCVAGPVQVELAVQDRQVSRIRTRVGIGFGSAAGVTQLGGVSAAQAVDLLLEVAARAPSGTGEDALFPVTLAEGVQAGPRLVRLASDRSVPSKTREKAVFWAAESGASADELSALFQRVDDLDVREQVLFAYSRLPGPASARELLRVARGDGSTALRKKAVFWLGQKAGREITGQLGELVRSDADAQVREHAIFALSQRPRDEGIPALVQVARSNPDSRLRKRALFWLGQSNDPRALDVFEEILVK